MLGNSSAARYRPLNDEDENEEPLTGDWDYMQITIVVLKVVLWCLLMALFVMLEFGAVFFIISMFYFMFTNFRKTEKAPNELSAYSVFNPHCESIKGTLTAQQFENEIKFGLGGFH
ncbi:SAYSvFN domain-containing protein 1 [Nephila pilipes]|uniref:SAYSvFN domain-containing protein 1 n=1 Tax=Nephila pilipes TaxID=299642 RepID=A0A8X6P879_NEPPI|nr:SAYSvFN domain-containing protein 1 [Nephila pilipes]